MALVANVTAGTHDYADFTSENGQFIFAEGTNWDNVTFSRVNNNDLQIVVAGTGALTATYTGYFTNATKLTDLYVVGQENENIPAKTLSTNYRIQYELKNGNSYDFSSETTFKYDLTVASNAVVQVTGLNSDKQNLILNSPVYNRTFGSNETVDATLQIVDGNKTVNITDYGDFDSLPAFLINGSLLDSCNLNVTANADYVCSDSFKETILINGDIKLTNFDSTSDHVLFATGANTKYSLTNEGYIIENTTDSTKKVTLSDVTAAKTGTFEESTADILSGDNGKTLYVSNLADFDGSDSAFKNYRIIGASTTSTGTLQGGSGDDTIIAGAGGDNIYGNGGNDTIIGGAGDDNISGGYGNDTIYGGSGNDIIEGYKGKNKIVAGELVNSGTEGAINIGTQENPEYILFNTDGVTINGGDDNSNSDKIYAGGDNNTINTICAKGGNDEIHLYGGKNNIVLPHSTYYYEEIGVDSIYGATINDTLYFAAQGNYGTQYSFDQLKFERYENWGKVTNDLVIYKDINKYAVIIKDFFNPENQNSRINKIVTKDNDSLVEHSIKTDAVITVGLDKNETFVKPQALDGFKLNVKFNADTWINISANVRGLQGCDEVSFDGSTTLTADGNALTFSYQSLGIYGQKSITVLDFFDENSEFNHDTGYYEQYGKIIFANKNITVTNRTNFSNENNYFKSVNITGTSGNDILKGGSGNDKITSGDGNDVIYGNGGNDTITVGSGADKLYYSGNFGHDEVNGLTSDDKIYFTDVNRSQLNISANGTNLVIGKGDLQDGNYVTIANYIATSENKFNTYYALNEAGIQQAYNVTGKVAFEVPETLENNITIDNSNGFYNGLNFAHGTNISELTFTRTADNVLQVSGGALGVYTITVSNFDYEAEDVTTNINTLTANGEGTSTIAEKLINYEISDNYYKPVTNLYHEAITVANDATVAISGLDGNDTLTLNGKNSRTWSTTDKDILVITDTTNNKTVTVTDYFTANANHAYYPETGELNVILNDTVNAYSCTSFAEIITGKGIVNGGTENTTVLMGNHCDDIVTCVGNDITFTNGDTSNITIQGFLNNDGEVAYTGNLYIDNNGDGTYEGVALSDKTINVSGRANFNNIVVINNEEHNIFANVNITGTNDKECVYITGDGDDTIVTGTGMAAVNTGAGDDTITTNGECGITGGKGDDTIIINNGSEPQLLTYSEDEIGKDTIIGATVNTWLDMVIHDEDDNLVGYNIDDLMFSKKGDNLCIYTKYDEEGNPVDDDDYITVQDFFTAEKPLDTVVAKYEYEENKYDIDLFSIEDDIYINHDATSYFSGTKYGDVVDLNTGLTTETVIENLEEDTNGRVIKDDVNHKYTYISDFDGTTVINLDAYAQGGKNEDDIHGSDGNDYINGGLSNRHDEDYLYGRAGNDILIAGEDDIVNGGKGDDIIILKGDWNEIEVKNEDEGFRELIIGASNTTRLHLTEYAPDELTFALQEEVIDNNTYKSLFITTNSENENVNNGTIIIRNYFNTEKKFDDIVTSESEDQYDTFSIKKSVVFDITVAQDETFDKTTSVYKGLRVNVSLADGATSANVKGLEKGDNINIGADYVLSRTAEDSNLTISQDTNTITILDYDYSSAPKFTVAGQDSATNLNVTANADYTCSDSFMETILINGDITLTNFDSTSDHVLFETGANTKYSLTNEGYIIENTADSTKKVTLSVVTAAKTGTFEESTADILSGDNGKTLYVSNLADFDGSDSAFKNYRIIGASTTSTGTLQGGSGDDTIFAGAAGDNIYGNGGNDEIHLSGGKNNIILPWYDSENQDFGVDTIYDVTEKDTLYFARETGNSKIGYSLNQLKFERCDVTNDLIIYNDSTTQNAVIIKDFFNPENQNSRINKIVTKDNGNLVEHNIKTDAAIIVNLENDEAFAKPQALDGYKLRLTYNVDTMVNRNASVQGLQGCDEVVFDGPATLTVDGNAMVFSYKSKGTDGDKTITVLDFFNADSEFNHNTKYYEQYGEIIFANKDITVTNRTSFSNENNYFKTVNVIGTDANDTLKGGSGIDKITAGEGNDVIYAGNGNDNIFAEAGNDTIYTGNGNDLVVSGEGDDTIYVDGYGYKTIYGGNGNNTYFFDKGSAILKDTHAGDTIKFATFDFSKIEFVRGEGDNANDLLIKSRVEGDNDAIVISNYFALNENERISSFNVQGIQYTLEWRNSNVASVSGSLYNIIKNDNQNPKYIDGIRNWVDGDNAEGVKINGRYEYDMLSGTSHNDVIRAGINGAEIYGNDGDDELYGSNKNDYIVGGTGNDKIYIGNDALDTDTISFISASPQDALNFGHDTVYGANFVTTLKFALDMGESAENRYIGYKATELEFEKSGTSLLIKVRKNNAEEYNIAELANYYDKKGKISSGAADDIIALNGSNELSNYSIKALMTKDKIDLSEYDFEDLTFVRDMTGNKSNDLVIKIAGKTDDTVIANFFKQKNPIDILLVKDDTVSIKNEVTINVITENKNYTGTTYREVVTSSSSNETYNLKTNKDEIILSGNFGKDTVTLNNNQQLTLTFDDIEKVKRIVSGKDVILRYDDGSENPNQITIKDYVNKNYKNTEVIVKDVSDKEYSFDEVYFDPKTEGVKVKGTKLDEGYMSTSANEKINLKTGDDFVGYEVKVTDDGVVGWGDDRITVNKNEFLSLYIKDEFLIGDTKYTVQNKYEEKGKDLVIVSTAKCTAENSPIGYDEEYDLGTITLIGGLNIDSTTNIEINEYDLSSVRYDYENNDIITALKYDEGDVSRTGMIKGTQLSDGINLTNYISKNGKGVKIDTKGGEDFVIGSKYNDTIKSTSGSNRVEEYAGKNKITTGSGDDLITASGTSSNAINAGNGNNWVWLESTGINKLTVGKGNNYIYATDGKNTIKAGNGGNLVKLQGGINTVTTGSGADEIIVWDPNSTGAQSINTIKTGSGADTITIDTMSENTINAGNGGKNRYGQTVGNKITLANGINKVTSGKNADKITVSGGQNIIKSGAGDDIFAVSGGTSIIDGQKGNDIYNIDITTFKDSLIITDTKGANVLNLGADNDKKVNLFFDVSLNKKGKAVFSQIKFSTDDTTNMGYDGFDNFKGVEVLNKNVISKLEYGDTENGTHKSFTIKSAEINKLAADIASWLQAKPEYSSTDDVFANGNAGDIAKLTSAYTNFAKDGYVFNKAHSLIN